jgi:hypothetical protein
MTNLGNLIARLLVKVKYFLDVVMLSIGHNPSYESQSIWSTKFVVKGEHKWTIGKLNREHQFGINNNGSMIDVLGPSTTKFLAQILRV